MVSTGQESSFKTRCVFARPAILSQGWRFWAEMCWSMVFLPLRFCPKHVPSCSLFYQPRRMGCRLNKDTLCGENGVTQRVARLWCGFRKNEIDRFGAVARTPWPQVPCSMLTSPTLGLTLTVRRSNDIGPWARSRSYGKWPSDRMLYEGCCK